MKTPPTTNPTDNQNAPDAPCAYLIEVWDRFTGWDWTAASNETLADSVFDDLDTAVSVVRQMIGWGGDWAAGRYRVAHVRSCGAGEWDRFEVISGHEVN